MGGNIGRASYTSEPARKGRPCNIKIGALPGKEWHSFYLSGIRCKYQSQAHLARRMKIKLEFNWAASGGFKSFHCSNRLFGMLRPGMLCRGRLHRYGGRIKHTAYHLVRCINFARVAKLFLTFRQISVSDEIVHQIQLFCLPIVCQRTDFL